MHRNTLIAGAGYYLTSAYLPACLTVALHLPDAKVSVILFLSSLAELLVT